MSSVTVSVESVYLDLLNVKLEMVIDECHLSVESVLLDLLNVKLEMVIDECHLST